LFINYVFVVCKIHSLLIIQSGSQVSSHSGEEDDIENSTSVNIRPKGKAKANNGNKKKSAGELAGKTRTTKEEKARLMNEKKQQKEVGVVVANSFYMCY